MKNLECQMSSIPSRFEYIQKLIKSQADAQGEREGELKKKYKYKKYARNVYACTLC